MLDGSVFSEQRGKTADLRAERGTDVLGCVGGEIANAGKETREDDVRCDEVSEACVVWEAEAEAGKR